VRAITRFRFAKALVEGWNVDGNMSGAILRAADLPVPAHSDDMWAALREQVYILYPSAFPQGFVYGKRPVRAFIAVHFPKAAAFLDAGLPNRAHKNIILSEGAAAESRLSAADRLEWAADRKLARRTRVVSARALDKRHDWSTVK
jgi:hypothetical protein